jgi:hypothetical protein
MFTSKSLFGLLSVLFVADIVKGQEMVECLGIKNTCEIQSLSMDLFESGMVINFITPLFVLLK